MDLNLLKDNLYDMLKEKSEKISLQPDLMRYNRKFHQCNLIISRIIENHAQFHILDEKVWEFADREEKILSDEEQALVSKHGRLSSLISFDVEDYFIHIQILIDRLAVLIANQIKELPISKIKSFRDLINFIKTQNSQNELFDYLLKQEKWFKLLINIHRNKLIVHDNISQMTGTKYSKNQIHSPIRLGRLDSSNSKTIISTLNKIKENHVSDILELKNEVNIWKLLLICDYNAEKLTDPEVNEIINIHKNHGGEMPEIDLVNTKIQNFLDYVNSFFKKSIQISST